MGCSGMPGSTTGACVGPGTSSGTGTVVGTGGWGGSVAGGTSGSGVLCAWTAGAKYSCVSDSCIGLATWRAGRNGLMLLFLLGAATCTFMLAGFFTGHMFMAAVLGDARFAFGLVGFRFLSRLPSCGFL